MPRDAGCLLCFSYARRQVAADALQRLYAQQVLLEQARRQRWEAALAAWRTLRSKHAITCFCEHIVADLSEPPARLDAFAQLRAAQEDAHVQLQQLCKRVGQLLPPHLSSDAVKAWVAATQKWSEGWQHQLQGRLQQLQEQEDEVEEQVGRCRCAQTAACTAVVGLVVEQARIAWSKQACVLKV
jgi:hypothetical protein